MNSRDDLELHDEYLRNLYETEDAPVAAIQAFVMAVKSGLEPSMWAVKALTETFDNWLSTNGEAHDHKDYLPLDHAFKTGRKTFREMEKNSEEKETAQKIFALRWAFELPLSQAVPIAIAGGFVSLPQTDEKDLAHRFARSDFAKHYEVFCKVVEAKGFSRRQTAEHLIGKCRDEKTRSELLEVLNKKP